MKYRFLSYAILFALVASLGFGAKQTINVGTSANDGTGDSLRIAFGKANANFTELYDGTHFVNITATGNVDLSAATTTLGPISSGTTMDAPIFTGNAVAVTATGGDNDTSIATTAFVQSAARGSETGVHATPSTANPLSPTWTSIMHVVWYGATGTINLPAASGYSGRSILIYNTGAFTITIDPNASEVVVRDGNVQTGGVSFTLSSGAGNYVGLISDGARWITLGYKGTLAVGS